MATATCYRHTNRTTGASCTRCGRPICPDCMIQAPVGHHCPTCVQEARGDMRRVQRVRPSAPGAIKAGVVAGVLIAVNVVVFVLDLGDPDITRRYADNALLVANRDEYYRMITAAFLHAGLLHLGFNMFGLYLFGSQLEQAVGPPRFLVLYVLSAVGGAACSHFFGPPYEFSVGASGAVFGILGAYAVIAKLRNLDVSQVGGLILLNLFIGAVIPQIDNAAHVGGLLTGAALGGAFEWASRQSRTNAVAVQVTAVAAVAAVIAVATLVRVDQLRVI
jgi:membrane associated rhomboid family serine protease